MQPKIYIAPFYLIAAAFIGIGDTLFLSYNHFLGITPSCAILNGCEKVLNSVYSAPLGVPFAYLGLLFYLYMFAAAVLLAYDPTSKGLRLGLLAYTAFGLVCSIGFELLQIIVIKALCMYCALSALTTLALFCIAVWHYHTSKKPNL